MAELREGQRLKYTVTHYRQPHLTHEEFMKWIVDEHLPLAMPVFKKYGVLSYTLVSYPFHSIKPCPLTLGPSSSPPPP